MRKIEEKIKLQHLTVKNRLIRSAVHSFLGNSDGTMTDAEYDMYETLAKNNVGLIITGHCSVSPQGQANEEQINIYEDRFITQFTKVRDLVHVYGSKFVVQINHAGPRAIHNDDLIDVVECDLKKDRHARAVTIEEIKKIEEQFIAAAVRLQKAGVDGVQIHAAHSYLLSRFLDETFNQRVDQYGGSIENRFRICREIIQGIKKACGQDFPVLIKINNDSKTNDEQYGQEMLYVLQECKVLQVELVEFSGVDFISLPRTASLYYLERIAKLKSSVDVPIALVGGVQSLDDMDKVLASGIDMVSLGRPLICEPNLFPNLLAGQEKAKCLSCNRCFAIPHIKPGIRCVLHRKLKKTK